MLSSHSEITYYNDDKRELPLDSKAIFCFAVLFFHTKITSLCFAHDIGRGKVQFEGHFTTKRREFYIFKTKESFLVDGDHEISSP